MCRTNEPGRFEILNYPLQRLLSSLTLSLAARKMRTCSTVRTNLFFLLSRIWFVGNHRVELRLEGAHDCNVCTCTNIYTHTHAKNTYIQYLYASWARLVDCDGKCEGKRTCTRLCLCVCVCSVDAATRCERRSWYGEIHHLSFALRIQQFGAHRLSYFWAI